MGVRELEKKILEEARQVTGKPNLKMKDILEWSTGEVKPEKEGEKVYRLPGLSVNICILE